MLFITKEALAPWLQNLAKSAQVFATQLHERAVVFKSYTPDQELVLERESVTSAKGAIFPQSLPFFFFKAGQGGSQQQEIKAEPESGPRIVFGARPCGAHGFQTFDRVFDGIDPYFQELRKHTAFITLACDRPGSTCFCHWVGGGPANTWGSDVLLTPLADGFTAQVITERGEELVKAGDFQDAGEREQEALAVQEHARQSLGGAVNLDDIAPALDRLFTDLDFWDEMTAGCSGCGVCTYLCPTCYCFNITDESDGISGARLRTWDSCMFHQYTQEASGHNPRPSKSHRMRNRVGHKYWYHPHRFAGEFSCCGCGRCVKYCPGAVDIRHILTSALERYHRKDAGDKDDA